MIYSNLWGRGLIREVEQYSTVQCIINTVNLDFQGQCHEILLQFFFY
jgi:hypothetical protein